MAQAQFVTIQEAAEILDENPWTVMSLMESGELTAIRVVETASLEKYQGEKA